MTFLSIHPRPRGRSTQHPKETGTFLRALGSERNEKRAETPRRRRRPIKLNSERRRTNETRAPGRARARGRALVFLRLFIYCCAEQRARRACDARVVISFEHGVRRGLSVDRKRGERLLWGFAKSEGCVTSASYEPTAAAGASAAAAAARPRPAGLPADDAPLTPRADGSGSPSRAATLRQPATHLDLRPVSQRVQAGRLSRSKSCRVYYSG